MLLATALALTAAVLHAGWNLFAKRSVDPLFALWTQFMIAGAAGVVIVLATGGLPAGAWAWAGVSGLFHMPYIAALGWAYRHGDFSLAYPIARGGGALLAAIGGLALLGDNLGLLPIAAIVVIVAGMALLATGAAWPQVAVALVVAVTIGGYTLVDSHAARTYGRITYVCASQASSGVAATVVGIALRQVRDLTRLPLAALARTSAAAATSLAAYGLVLVAVRHAEVGYVAALRESSVLIAAVAGARILGEQHGRARVIGAAVIVSGLVLLVAAH